MIPGNSAMKKLFAPCLAWVCLALAAPAAASDQRGIYLYSEHPENKSDYQNLLDALSVPGVDGVTILVGWKAVEPMYRVFAWSGSCVDAKGKPCPNLLDDLLGKAVAAGKKVDLAIRAGGQDTPDWLFQTAGATPLEFYNLAGEGLQGTGCNLLTMAAPWDGAFLAEWDYLLQQVAQRLQAENFYNAVASVRLTGINRTTAELRLPAEILENIPSPGCPPSGVDHFNNVEAWLTAPVPYRPSRLLGAWDAITTMFQKYFPDKFFTLPIIPSASGNQNREYPFPPIDDNGCPYAPPWSTDPSDVNFFNSDCVDAASFPGAFPPNPDQNAPLIDIAARKFPGRLAVAYQNLDLRRPAQPYVVYSSDKWHTAPAFQTNDYINLQQAACPATSTDNFTKPCDDTTYLELLNLGIFPCATNTRLCKKDPTLQSEYIEALPPDVYDENSATPTYNDDIAKAHAELLTPPWVEFQFPPLPIDTGGWRNTLPLTGTVLGSMDTTVAPYNIQSLTCAGAKESASLGLNTPSASADLTISKEGSHLVSCTAVSTNPDTTANQSQFKLLLLIDTTPPATKANVSFFQSGLINAAQITLSAADNLSGVVLTQYRIDGSAWDTGTEFDIKTEGTHTIDFRSADLAGNVEPIESIEVTVTTVCKKNCL